ncbi:MAG: hypothetical protein H7Z14_13355, partial [Anaerolineae bacterium]|nr:hypothetical protein [Phycisphaerae bacterium]
VERNAGKPVTVNGEAGDDFIDFNFYTQTLDNTGGGSFQLLGGPGFDQVFCYDNANPDPDAYTITSARFDRPFWAGFNYASDLEALNLTTGTAANTVNVRSTFTNQPIYLFSAGGQDTVNVGQTNGIQSINANVHIFNSPSFTTININDTGNTLARSGDIDNGADPAFGRLSGLAPGQIWWKLADVASINLTTGAAADNLIIYRNSEVMNLNSAGGQDNVQIGHAGVGGLQFITGAITVNNSPSHTNLIVTDAGSNVAKNANMDFAGSNAFGRVTNLAPVPIVWNNNDINNVTIITGNASDTLLLYSNTEDLRFNSSGGNDTLFFGAFSVGGLQFISGTVSVDNSSGTTEVVVDDNGTTTTKTAVTVTHPAGTYTHVQSFAPALLKFADTGISQVQLRSGQVTAIQPDKFDVQATKVRLFFFNNGGNDGVNLGGGPLGADGVQAQVEVSGTPGSTSIGFADFGVSVPRNITHDDNGSQVTVTGFGPFSHILHTGTITSTAYALGNALDQLAIRRTSRPVNVSNNTAGNPTDIITVGSPTVGLNGITANIAQTITLSPMAFVLNDSINSAARTYTFQPQFFGSILFGNRIVFNGTNYVEYIPDTRTQSVDINAGSGADTFNVPISRSASLTLNGNNGADAYNLATHATEVSDPIRISGPGGLDTLNVNAENGSTGSAVMMSTMHFSNVVLGTGGNLTVAAGGNKVLSTQNLTLGTNSKIDLTDNDMVLDYAGGTQLPAVQQLINAMRNGGAWNGTRGITSSSAAAANPKNKTLGALEATSFKSINGPAALFSGETIDTTAVLVKYTYYGDVDFNGIVDFDDYSRVDAGFNGNKTGWFNGDVDGNGVVDFDDYSLIDQAFNTQSGVLRGAGAELPGRTPRGTAALFA